MRLPASLPAWAVVRFDRRLAPTLRVRDHASAACSPPDLAAGTPTVCAESILERVPRAIAARFGPRPDCLLIVRGDSMNRTGPRDSDIVAIRWTLDPESG